MATPRPEFESDVTERIYRYVERRGSATHEEVRDAIQVPEAVESKPARSGTEPSVPLPVDEFNDHVAGLLDAGHLVERGGRLSIAPGAESEIHQADDFEYEVRPAHEEDREEIADRIREVADEGAIVVDERVADAIGHGATDSTGEGNRVSNTGLIRLNERESRMFFVAERATESEEGSSDEADVEAGVEDEAAIIGWVHLHGFELPARDHTAKLTVGVAPEYREQGIGSTLLERGMVWADEAECIKVYQSVPATNEEALEMLENHGWEREATRTDHYKVEGELVDEVQLAKRLDDE